MLCIAQKVKVDSQLEMCALGILILCKYVTFPSCQIPYTKFWSGSTQIIAHCSLGQHLGYFFIFENFDFFVHRFKAFGQQRFSRLQNYQIWLKFFTFVPLVKYLDFSLFFNFEFCGLGTSFSPELQIKLRIVGKKMKLYKAFFLMMIEESISVTILYYWDTVGRDNTVLYNMQ